MARRKRKLISIRKPRLRVTSKGVKMSAPSARIGGKVGLNLSKSGVSASVRTKYGTLNSKHGFSSRASSRRSRRKADGCLPGCGILILIFMIIAGAGRISSRRN